MRVKILPLVLLCIGVCAPAFAAQRLKVSDNKHFIVRDDGSPFFYLGDTAWELFHRLSREDAETYLKDRAAKAFTIIQCVALAEEDGLHIPNAYGFTPLIGDDPTTPDVKAGPQNDYWDHVDFIVEKANSLGLTVGFLPTWGDKWNKKWGVGPEIFTPENAAIYGEWLGRRYREKDLIWILGGDRPIENDRHLEILRAMARGLKKGDGGAHLITLHPSGGSGSADKLHGEDWLDFNMRQNGHVAEYARYALTHTDYLRTPTKPVLDAEPIYEDHPISFKAADFGHSVAADVRRPLYWDLFGGACGHTYGHHSIWQFAAPGRKPVNNPLLPWPDALQQPGAAQMQLGRHLIESRPILTRIPDDTLIVTAAVPTAVPGAGRYRYTATRDAAGTFAMIYVPCGRPFAIHMDKITGAKITATWFDPRTGKTEPIGTFPNTGERTFTPPAPGEDLDWVLVLDDAAKNYPPPGQPH